MRWILALIGGVLGSVVGDEEGLAVGLLAGGLVGWLIERERQRAQFLATRTTQTTLEPPRPAQGSTAHLLDLTRRVEQLERTVRALETAQSAAGTARPLERSVAVEPAHVVVASADAAAPLSSDAGGAAFPAEPAPSAVGPAEPEDREHKPAPTPRERAVAEAYAASADGRVELDEFGWPREPGQTAAKAPSPPGMVGAPAAPPSPPSAALAAIRSFLFGGNTVVRIGILVLTVGVGLLVKYAADQAYFPLELRLALAAGIGLLLVVVGYRQRTLRPAFGTALQGGGVAAIYLVTFFAYYAYHLLPPMLTLALLVAIAALSSVLAVVQDAQQLAVFGAIGGFLSPVLASTGAGSHVALFSYYALLNVAICGSAIFRSWRILNWVGFAFTFGVASAWGALQYEPANMATASLFLAIFFLLYVLDATLFALRQPSERRGTIDTTLTFGTPLATLLLAGGLFRLEHLYLALSCVLISAVYFAVARWLVARRDDAVSALARAYVAIGIGVATLAVPFAVDSALATALAWSAEASGLVWVGIKQQRLRTRIGGYLLFAAALVALLARQDEASAAGRAVFFALIALALAFGAAQIERHRAALRTAEPAVGHVLLALGLMVWTGAWESLIDGLLPPELDNASWLVAIALTTLLLELGGTRASFFAARQVASVSLALTMIATLMVLFEAGHPLADLGWLGFAAAFSAGYLVLWRQRQQTALSSSRARPSSREGADPKADLLHASGAYALAILLFAEARSLAEGALASGWVVAACLLAPLGVVALALGARPAWPLREHARAYRRLAAWPIALLISLAALLCQFANDGSAAPLPYLPLLNPFDLAQALLLAAVLLLARTPELKSQTSERVALWGAAASGFVALNGSVVRTAHYWADVPFRPWQVPTAPVVQSAFSILWTTLSLLAMLLAHRRRRREVWIVGAVLLAAVVLKLFFLDLSQLSGVAKIVTFLAVGLLLLLIGYVAPVPPAERAAAERS